MDLKLKNNIKVVSQILLGSIIYVIGINFFLVPSGIFTTGLMGIAQEISGTISLVFNLDLVGTDKLYILIQTFAYWALNIPILIFGFNKVGKKFTIKTFIISSVVTQFFFNTLVINHNIITEGGKTTLASEIVAVIAGSILIGIGMGLIIKSQASTGGTDILSVYFSLYKGISFGTVNLVINAIVVVWAIALTKDLTTGILIFISLYIQSFVVDTIYNYNKKITLIIFTHKEKEVAELILDNKRSYTKLEGVSGYTKEKISVLLVIINKEEARSFTELIEKIDENVFIDMISTESVKGNFSNKYFKDL